MVSVAILGCQWSCGWNMENGKEPRIINNVPEVYFPSCSASCLVLAQHDMIILYYVTSSSGVPAVNL